MLHLRVHHSKYQSLSRRHPRHHVTPSAGLSCAINPPNTKHPASCEVQVGRSLAIKANANVIKLCRQLTFLHLHHTQRLSSLLAQRFGSNFVLSRAPRTFSDVQMYDVHGYAYIPLVHIFYSVLARWFVFGHQRWGCTCRCLPCF